MLVLQSRADARIDGEGNLVRLEDQDRVPSGSILIDEGLRFMGRSARGMEVTEYHLQAAIASQNAIASSFDETNWPEILHHYDLLARLLDSPVVAMNRLVAFEGVYGSEAALNELEVVRARWEMETNHQFHAIQARFYERLGRTDDAAAALSAAIVLTTNQIEQRFLARWRAALPATQET